MSRAPMGVLAVLGLSLVGAVVLPGCTGAEVQEDSGPKGPDTVAYASLASSSWPVTLVDAQARAPYETDAWVSLFLKRDYRTAVERSGADGGLASARMHADLAGLYRQGALSSGNALVQTYEARGRETDPTFVQHLVALGHGLNASFDKAKAASDKLEGYAGDEAVWHAPWAAVLAEPAVGTLPDLSGLPTGLGEVAPGTAPLIEGLPHYRLREKIEAESFIDMADRQMVELQKQREQLDEAMGELSTLRQTTLGLLD